jgi:hypothetical protein
MDMSVRKWGQCGGDGKAEKYKWGSVSHVDDRRVRGANNVNGGGDRQRNKAVANIFVCIKFFRLFVAQASSGQFTRGCDVAMPVLTEAQLTAVQENKRRVLERKESV